jgi:ADP-ribose pyrophosphatase
MNNPQVFTPVDPEEIKYQGKIIEVVQQKMQVADKTVMFEFARRSPGTRLIILSPEKQLLITKEYRSEIQDFDYRLPGGKVFDTLKEYNEFLAQKKDILEPAEAAAKREALEETGLEPESIEHFHTSTCGSTVVWDLIYFVVDKYSANSSLHHNDPGENIELVWMSLEEAKALCLSGKMQEDRTVGVLLRFLHTKLGVA